MAEDTQELYNPGFGDERRCSPDAFCFLSGIFHLLKTTYRERTQRCCVTEPQPYKAHATIASPLIKLCECDTSRCVCSARFCSWTLLCSHHQPVYIVYRHFGISFQEGRGSLLQKQAFLTYVRPQGQVLGPATAVGWLPPLLCGHPPVRNETEKLLKLHVSFCTKTASA